MQAIQMNELAEKLFKEHQITVYCRVDRLFAGLMAFQWVACVFIAMVISPRTWEGLDSTIHPHVWAAVILGGIVSVPPILLGIFKPGATYTRYVIAVAQMLTSGLLIHLTAGRLESHFHIFGSLAFLSFYRDWKVIIPATVVTALDHLLRNLYYPQSIYGVMEASNLRWLEHAGWVIFEDIFLIAACLRNRAEMRDIAMRTAESQESEARTRRVIDSALDAVVIADVDGHVSEWNMQAERAFGYSAEEAVGHKLCDLILPVRDRVDGEAPLMRRVAEACESGSDVLARRMALTVMRRDGSEFTAEVSSARMTWGEHSLYNLFVRDITERQKAETALLESKEAAEAASRAKSEFLANMSHEIRTPMNGVIGMTDLLLNTTLDERQRRHGLVVKRSAESLLSIINDILDFSKIEAGKMELDQRDYDLWIAVEDVVETFAVRASEKKVELASHVDPTVPHQTYGDPDRVRQILVNLIGNAMKFTKEGSIIVRVTKMVNEKGQSLARFAVSDTGIGIPKDRMDRLFKSFSQVDASTTRQYGGTGLGLAIAKQLTEMMGGEIGVESEIGRGTTFWFTVALNTPQTKSVTSKPTTAVGMKSPSIDVRGLRVLVVGEHEGSLRIIEEQLGSWGFASTIVRKGSEAVAALQAGRQAGRPYRVMITDPNLPDMSATELARRVRHETCAGDTTLMILAPMHEEREVGALPGEFCGQLTKPVRQSQLFDTIIDAVAKSQHSIAKAAHVSLQVGESVKESNVGSGIRSGRILLVEDNEVNQMVAEELLTGAGFTCTIASDGKRAVELSGSESFDLILMDCQMPEMDGFQATAAIREREKTTGGARMPIIALTANAMNGDRERCLKAGMDDYLTKPLKPEALLRMIDERLISRPAANVAVVETKVTVEPIAAVEEAPAVVPAIDIVVLRERCLNKPALMLKVLKLFQTNGPAYAENVAKAFAINDAKATGDAAHTLKGSAGYLAAATVQAVSADIEKTARHGDLADAKDAIDRLQQAMAECLVAIPEIIATVEPPAVVEKAA